MIKINIPEFFFLSVKNVCKLKFNLKPFLKTKMKNYFFCLLLFALKGSIIYYKDSYF